MKFERDRSLGPKAIKRRSCRPPTQPQHFSPLKSCRLGNDHQFGAFCSLRNRSTLCKRYIFSIQATMPDHQRRAVLSVCGRLFALLAQWDVGSTSVLAKERPSRLTITDNRPGRTGAKFSLKQRAGSARVSSRRSRTLGAQVETSVSNQVKARQHTRHADHPALHRQFRISGMSWPYLSMYCLCSMSLS